MKLISQKDSTATEAAVIDAVSPVQTDETTHARFGWWIVLVGVGGFLLWATLAPLDKGVPLSGSVMVATNRKAVQHQTGGIVDDILVKEGDRVKAGQVLVKMNDIQVKALAEVTRGQLITARAVEARLIAERDNKPDIDFPPFLLSSVDDSRAIGSVALQKQLFISRNAVLKHELAALDENIAGLSAQLRGLESSRGSKEQQLQFLKEQLENMRELAREGYVPRNRVLELERTHAQLNGDMFADTGNIGRIQRQISELNLRRIQRLEEHQKEVRQQLTDVQREAEALNSRLLAQDFELANVLVKAPVDGIVVGINIFTRGGVIGPGFRIMDIVPTEDLLVIEGQVPVHLIDKVHAGLDVDFIFTAFNQNKIPRISGFVTHVSADRLIDEQTGIPYYQLKAKVTPEGMKSLTEFQIRAGMPVEIFVKTGERSLMNYLLKPILDRIHTSLVED
ncbi:HlyD family type I secretion periplasmic adaptor subunit [Nitrosomonas sp. Nm58]|uniref:HlyD family type I secretion periplasmic adaptor subunit n=1 Tax=Nitrosomonas sp. Nm58 TaxID=200126 RepID=UPI00089C5DBE|nr:HlyD family type I secretion periplasmic adaptor subunit [Nitrosomonas sp. Nm58]SDY12729.1 membrane fusion protein, protease secretion system [Nitrosomonas sp. Nm58]